MSRFREYLFVLTVSFEFVFILLGIILGLCWQPPLRYLATLLDTSAEVLRYLAFVPIGLAVWNINESKKLLFPDHDKTNILHEWPNYWKLRVRFGVSFFYSCIFALAGISSWLLGLSTKNTGHLALIICSILGSLSVSISIYWARINEEEALRKITH